MNQGKSRITLLLVDDEEQFLDVTSTVLSRRGIHVLTAASGLKALEILEREAVDVVVLDIKMPGMDGVEVFDHIKRATPGIPVIILTGHASIDQAFTMSREGVYDYLAKPCNMESLSALVLRAAATRTRRESSPPTEADPPERRETIRVLLVDDEPDLLESLSKILRRRNMEVHCAESGEEALVRLDRTLVDVVVLDVKMPGMGGLEALVRIRAGFPHLPVLLLTGHPTVENALEGIRKGALEYLMKPPDIQALVLSIRQAYQSAQRQIEEDRNKMIRDIFRRFPD